MRSAGGSSTNKRIALPVHLMYLDTHKLHQAPEPHGHHIIPNI